jgi:hypothetical protein
VVEAKDRLGGRAKTYHDPVTGGTVDIGVLVFEDEPLVRNYFSRFGVGLTAIDFSGSTTYVDFRTGRPVAYAPAAAHRAAGLLPPDQPVRADRHGVRPARPGARRPGVVGAVRML